MSKVLRRLVVWLAFAGALLAPALARAALLPSCDAHEQLTRIRPAGDTGLVPALLAAPDAGPPEDACALPLAGPGDDPGDVRVPAMCDPRGASMIAPPRILPIADARIEAGPSCNDDPSAPVIGPGSRHAPAATPGHALAEHAVLDATVLVPPAPSMPAPSFPPVTGGPRSGFQPGVDHPPRC